ncbi:31265_t:CDS:2, partial [Racocetra persica]
VVTNPIQRSVVEKRQSNPNPEVHTLSTYNINKCAEPVDILRYEIHVTKFSTQDYYINFTLELKTSMNLVGTVRTKATVLVLTHDVPYEISFNHLNLMTSDQVTGNSSFNLVQRSDQSILVCALVSIGSSPKGSFAPPETLSIAYNAPLVIGIAFVVLSYVISKTKIAKFESVDK